MDEQQAKIQEDLRGLIAGDVRCDDVYTQLFASDASIYQIRPLGVVRPRSLADVVACVKYAREHQIPLHARGAGTGLAGESLGAGLVLDFARYMRRVIGQRGDEVRVQPGLVLERLNAYLLPHGRWFGTDPATESVTTIGSVIAIDGAGSHSLRYGSARSRVRSMQVVLSDGEVVELGRESLADLPGEQNPRRKELITQVADLLLRNKNEIARHRSRAPFNCAGYYLDVLADGQLDLARLLVGSEGTLAIVTEATLETAPRPASRGVALLFFDRLDTAAKAALELLPLGPSACDLMDRRLLSLARDTDPRFDLLIPATAEAALLVEQEGNSEAEAREKIEQVVDRMTREKRLVFASQSSTDPQDVELFWQLAGKVVPRLYRLKGTTRPVPFVEDMAVPPAALPGFLTQLQNVLKRHQVTASLFAHAGHGQLHVRPFVDLTQSTAPQILSRLAEDLYTEVFAVGGTISGEHGDGLSRTPFVQQQYGELYRVFREVKWIFDPNNIFNPGKIIGDDPDLATHNLRPAALQPAPVTEPGSLPVVVPLQLDWTAAEVAQAAGACNGCGRCRTQEPEFRMCPIFRFAPGEEASPRAKANLMRSVFAGKLPPTAMASDDFKAVADLCVNCKMCKLECPASVDIPKLMLEAKAGYVAMNGLKASDWVISRLDLWSSLGNLISPLANWAIGNRQARWVIEKVFGIAHGRKLPRFAGRTFMRRAARRRLTRPTRRTGPKVLLFVDSYANYHDPQLAEALVALLEHHGIAVYVHPGQATSGMPLVALGVLDRAREIARHNVTLLAEGVRQGYTIVTAEPSAALALTQEYQSLLDDPDARLVADHTVEACAYLWKLHREGVLKRDLKPIAASLAYHQPCHLRALGAGSPGESLLGLIPELSIKSIDHGCSGMAGTYGLKRENYRNSLRAGWDLISSFRDPAIQGGVTECSACKMQMEQGTTKPTIHPIKLLALAYGLLPAGRSILSAKSEELIVT